MHASKVGFNGRLSLQKYPQPVPLHWRIKNYLKNVLPGEAKHFVATEIFGLNHMVGRLYLQQYRNGLLYRDYGQVSSRVVTTAFVTKLVDGMQSSDSEIADFKYHGAGTVSTGEGTADTALGGSILARVTGSQEEGGSANIYRTKGTISFDGSYTVEEWGIFCNTTGATLLDRSLTGGQAVEDGDSIVGTYDLTCAAGS